MHLVGTSMGGAVALDFAAAYPQAVRKLALVDAGGESYAAPPPMVTRALVRTGACAKLMEAIAWLTPRLKSQEALLGSLHRSEPGWKEAYLRYLESGGYERRVGPERVRAVPQPTLVVWGTEDPILPIADADKFELDLPRCAGVVKIEGSKHSPHIDNPEATEAALAPFLGRS